MDALLCSAHLPRAPSSGPPRRRLAKQVDGPAAFHQLVQQVFIDADARVYSSSSYHVSAQNIGQSRQAHAAKLPGMFDRLRPSLRYVISTAGQWTNAVLPATVQSSRITCASVIGQRSAQGALICARPAAATTKSRVPPARQTDPTDLYSGNKSYCYVRFICISNALVRLSIFHIIYMHEINKLTLSIFVLLLYLLLVEGLT